MKKIKNMHEFYQYFKSDDDCKHFLFHLKWEHGFVCTRCGHTKSWKGRTRFHQRCAGCDYEESCTANTIFHKIRFPLLKAFGMSFQIAGLKKGRSSIDLAKEFGVIQAAAWYFKNKVQKAMGTDDMIDYKMNNEKFKLSLDGIIITHRGKDLNGLQRIDVGLKMDGYGSKKLRFITSYCLLPHEDSLESCRLVKGKFKEFKTSILLWNFKVWLTGVHHHCSFTHLKGYLDEFFFKYNYRNDPAGLWYRLLQFAIKTKPAKITSRGLNI